MEDKIFWPETPLLESVGQHEPQIDRLRCRVETATRQSIIPLLAYARQYDQYLELMNLDIKTYIRSVLDCMMHAYDSKALHNYSVLQRLIELYLRYIYMAHPVLR